MKRQKLQKCESAKANRMTGNKKVFLKLIFFQNFEYAESDIPPLFQKNVSSYYF